MAVLKYKDKTVREMLDVLADMADANAYGDPMAVQEYIDQMRYILQDEVVE